MIKVWVNCLIAGIKVWNEVPENRKADVKKELMNRVDLGEITQERMDEIVGA